VVKEFRLYEVSNLAALAIKQRAEKCGLEVDTSASVLASSDQPATVTVIGETKLDVFAFQRCLTESGLVPRQDGDSFG
jgi:hypothetical protein